MLIFQEILPIQRHTQEEIKLGKKVKLLYTKNIWYLEEMQGEDIKKQDCLWISEVLMQLLNHSANAWCVILKGRGKK